MPYLFILKYVRSHLTERRLRRAQEEKKKLKSFQLFLSHAKSDRLTPTATPVCGETLVNVNYDNGRPTMTTEKEVSSTVEN